ncbi:putative glucan 1,3-alpha-glucosidase [Vitis vinifera]|uniref:Glucosidase II subunit alpha n=1 Tax=Vitis vinifera TaxID=29760 RepID=A0A438CEG5_VITVI|nr:putative glucan 1,3-alpha-glucosidase [Vitis vinifera]
MPPTSTLLSLSSSFFFFSLSISPLSPLGRRKSSEPATKPPSANEPAPENPTPLPSSPPTSPSSTAPSLQISANPPPESPDQDQIKPLLFTLSVYQNGVVRVKIDEDPSLDPPKKRFEVPDVILPEFESTKLWLQRFQTETVDGDSGPSSVVYVADGYEAVLRHNPFEVYVREKQGKRRVLSLNSHGLFDFEQLRVKQEGDDWEERFKGHTDVRPYGPQSISFDVSFFDADFVYGIPEHASSFALRSTRGPGVDDSEPYRLFNLDGTSGFFWLNAAEMQIDVLGSGWDAESGILLPESGSRIDTFWMSEAGIVDTFFFIGPGPKDVVRQYTSVTGMPAMPQLFSTAHHQCRWNYRDEEDVENVDSKFDEHDIPYDVLWLDIDHTDGKRYFTWDRVLFPNPEQMQNKLAAKGRHMVTIVDPHIKRDESFHLHKEATSKGYYVKDATGKDYDGVVLAWIIVLPGYVEPRDQVMVV